MACNDEEFKIICGRRSWLGNWSQFQKKANSDSFIYIITPFPLRGKQRYIIEWYSMYPLYARRFMLNVIGGAQPIAVLRALTHLILTCGFPHDVFLHRMSSRYLLYISFLKNSLVHGHYGDSNRRPFEIQVSRSPTDYTLCYAVDFAGF